MSSSPSPTETIVLGGGCFWCTEAVFDRVQGVLDVESGYSNGQTLNPSYEQICTGRTGHAEVVKLEFDPAQISLRELLEIFFVVHDPTTLNRQGNDVGTQYRSAVYVHSPEQETVAREVIAALDAQGLWDRPIVTEVTRDDVFYPAEDYHQEYFERHPFQPYCLLVIRPKVAKFRKQHLDRLKKKSA